MGEYFIDTNVLARFILGDIQDQQTKATKFLKKIEKREIIGKLSILVINELVWILEKYYEIDRRIYVPKVISIILLKHLKIIEIDKKIIIEVLDKFSKSKFDLTDIYLSFVANNKNIFSFDKDFTKISKI